MPYSWWLAPYRSARARMASSSWALCRVMISASSSAMPASRAAASPFSTSLSAPDLRVSESKLSGVAP